MTLYVILGCLAAIVFISVLWFVKQYNNFVRMSTNIEEAFSTMDIYLKKRFDLIPNLVESVKGYAKHESETLDSVIKARSCIENASTSEEKLNAESELSKTLRSLFAVSESYPDLKANENFIKLQNTLEELEDEIAMSRKFYNGNVKIYNNATKVFPSNIIAGMFKYEAKPMFEVSNEEERLNVKVQF